MVCSRLNCKGILLSNLLCHAITSAVSKVSPEGYEVSNETGI